VVRDPPLARALHRLAEVGDEIPEELYEATAAVLAHLYGGLSPGGDA
jgi:flagellar biosynthesis protein FlhB